MLVTKLKGLYVQSPEKISSLLYVSFTDACMHFNDPGSLTMNPTPCTILIVPELTVITYRTISV